MFKDRALLKSDQVWFSIEYGNNSRFIHLGHLSEGCVTIMALDKWNAIYDELIKHRVNGGEYIGQLHITR